EGEGDDLAAIGRALGVDGELRLWTCNTATGGAGEAFIGALARATGAVVVASSGLVGDAAIGGSWGLSAASPPPPAAAGLAALAGVLIPEVWNGGAGNNNPASGTWNSNTGVWNPANVPGAGDNVFLAGNAPAGGSYTVTLAVNTPTLGNLTIG